MKKQKIVSIIFIMVLFQFVFSLAYAEDAKNEGKPIIDFPEITFSFSGVLEGTPVIHEYIVRNTGDAPLLINKVKPG